MGQMNVSMTGHLAGYVQRKVKSGRYNNASEVVRDALRRMEEEDERAVRLAKPTAEDILSNLTQAQLDSIRGRVLEGLADLHAGNYAIYDGRDGLKQLAEQVKTQGRKLLSETAKR
ncbi:MAG: type II toxin-antitoxin system ParD family antitoxin [Acidobacteriaceae bacterium]